MLIVRHRVNTLAALAELPMDEGAEFDIRSDGGRLVMHHDPHTPGDDLVAWLDAWAEAEREGLLVFNPKEDGLEGELLRLADERGLTNFFLLDLTMPTTVRLTVREGVRQVAVRVSEYEPVALADRFEGLADWVWLDSFSGEPPALDVVRSLAGRFRICLVSPELQKYAPETITRFHALRPHLDAVCTKHPHLWETPS